MTKYVLIVIGVLLINIIFGQTNFNWEKSDSVAKNKTQIYSDTKMFIAKTWKSTKDVIQNDDKESGVILIKGIVQMKPVETVSYNYGYTVTFRMKDNKYKIILDNVFCESTYTTNRFAVVKIEPFEGDEYELANCICFNLSKKKAKEMMYSLKQNLQSIVDSYEIYIKYTSTLDGGW